MAQIHEVGKLRSKDERSVVHFLQDRLPPAFHVYHDLQLDENGKYHPYQYDVIVFNDARAWVLEVEGFGGSITGNSRYWHLANHRQVLSPIPLVQEKARVLKIKFEDCHLTWSDAELDHLQIEGLVVLNRKPDLSGVSDSQKHCLQNLSSLYEALTEPHTTPMKRPLGKDMSKLISSSRFRPTSVEEVRHDYILVQPYANYGTHSVIHLARHRYLKSRAKVALKEFKIDPGVDNRQREKLMRLATQAADAMMSIEPHRNLCRFFEGFSWDEDKFVIVMEWVKGAILADLLENGQAAWTLDHKIDLLMQLCDGIRHIHEHGIYHRRISPQAISIVEGRQVKLISFDLAKILKVNGDWTTTLTHDLLKACDPHYTAPEICHSLHNATRQTDIFSAGAVLFELISGVRAFPGGSDRCKKVPDLREFVPGCDGLNRIFRKMCALKPQDRYASMNDVLKDLHREQEQAGKWE